MEAGLIDDARRQLHNNRLEDATLEILCLLPSYFCWQSKADVGRRVRCPTAECYDDGSE